jgi:hypothetical protein
MIEQIITDTSAWKLRLKIKDCMRPEGLKHLSFSGEQYNDKGELTETSTYDFFLTQEEISKLWMTLANGVR